ncbi:MAG: hypothetical protein ACU0EF_10875, partial [Roseovarius sp.]
IVVKQRLLDLAFDHRAHNIDNHDQVHSFVPFVKALHVQSPEQSDLQGGAGLSARHEGVS